MRVIDLSVRLGPVAGEPVPVAIEYIDHRQGASLLGARAGLTHEDFPDGLGLSLEHVRLTSHSGTHVDAPAHYGPQSGGKRAQTIDEVSLERFFGNGVLVSCPGTRADGPVSCGEIQGSLKARQQSLHPGDIVLIHTGADLRWNTDQYFTDFRGVSREATSWLVQQGVEVIGIDSFGFDPPFDAMLSKYAETRDARALWPAHFFGREVPYFQIERLCNLDALLEESRFKVACFPIKLAKCGAAPSRVVAIVEES